MITIPLPDKWVRKAIYDLVNGQLVGGEPIPVFDQLTGDQFPDKYVRILDQSSNAAATTKCGWTWSQETIIECVERVPSRGNKGSRTQVDDIAQMVLTQMQGYDLDPGSGLSLVRYSMSSLTDFYVDDGTYVTAAKILSLTSFIN